MKIVAWVAFGLCLALTRSEAEGTRGVIDDPDGYVNVRASKGAEAGVVAKVKAGEPFTFEYEPGADWCKVTLKSGQTGWMHYSRIRLLFTKKDLPVKEPDANESEIEHLARRHEIDYSAAARKAVLGDAKAQKEFFSLAEHVDGAAAESFAADLPAVFHLIGDDAFASFLREQSLAYRIMVRNSFIDESVTGPFEYVDYLQRHFPKTAEIFFRKGIVDWPSPDGRYVIRKNFSDPLDLKSSRVAKAELIEKSSGKTVRDLTADDIGLGRDREGVVLWSPDSKRFAYLSSNLTVPPGNLFSKPPPLPQKKQTTVYQLLGDSFSRVDLPLNNPPGREDDAEIKGAVVGHEFIEPMKWAKAKELILERHDYYESLAASGSIHGFDRLYEITVVLREDGSADTTWKRRQDR